MGAMIYIFPQLTPGFHSHVKVKTFLQDDDVPRDNKMTKLIFTSQEKKRLKGLNQHRSKSPVKQEVVVDCKFSPNDLALASVPGQHFDPCNQALSEDDLKPQPMVKKSKKHFVPNDLKDDKYWARRRKNNMAAKRSREARRVKENQIVLRASFLEKENMALREEVQKLKEENEMLRACLHKAKVSFRERCPLPGELINSKNGDFDNENCSLEIARRVDKDDKDDCNDNYDVSSAFLGPNLWDKTLSDLKLEYIDLDEFLASNTGSLNQHRSKSPVKQEVVVDCKFSPNDLALASVPGQHFDPCNQALSEDDLKPQPMVKKSKKHFVPNDLKDDKYWARRRKNNMAAKRSREARRVKENQIVLRASFLEKENMALREEVQKLKEENEMLRACLHKYKH
ncbi:HLF [Cordylochernes scorpioides]|uniref:HLF n=1 Tax=Cordylochernes scorpioides TaxID=51811 RepID=A0ABY6KSK6_9ARAC|nr:HLF [Cordylochernes scorpioides]